MELVRKHGTKVMNDEELTYYISDDPTDEINRIIEDEFETIDAMPERLIWKYKSSLWLRFHLCGRKLRTNEKMV